MTSANGRRGTRRSVIAATAAVIIVLVVTGLYFLRPDHPPEPPEPTSSPQEPGIVESSHSSDLVVPGATKQASVLTFDADKGETFPLFSETEAVLDTSPGGARSAFAKITLRCSGGTESSSDEVFGTENIHSRQPRTFHLSMTYTARTSGLQECAVIVDVPSYPTGHGAATLHLASTIRSTSAPTPNASMASQNDQQPIVIKPGETRTISSPITRVPTEAQGVLAGQSVHLTTCTIENGSQDLTSANLCTPGSINRGGSTVTMTVTLDEVDKGTVCRRHDIADETLPIDYDTHHALASFGSTDGSISMTCGTSARLSTKIYNLGPAPLIVHRRSTVSVIAPFD